MEFPLVPPHVGPSLPERFLFPCAGQRKQPQISAWLAKDSYFTASEALATGLSDEITEPPPSAAADGDSPEASTAGPTEDERLFFAMLSAMGSNVQVRSKAEFGRNFSAWFTHSVSELG